MAVYNRKDSYYKKAKREGYKSRAAYKLAELNNRFKIIKKGSVILDCGAAPGGWSQVALEIIGQSGKVVAVDLNEITGINNPNFIGIVGDFTKNETLDRVLAVSNVYDTVISDIAPHTIGIRDADHLNSLELVSLVYEFTKKVLKPNGCFLFKLFEGNERQGFVNKLKKNFRDVKIVRPDATRSGSVEIYVAAFGYVKAEESNA
ncbi:MAG: RlmE family RNA methyltransferase [Deferribacterales bacterium]|nr:RlmE family RNA methyltransferase [Deferribacterales bacterium]